MQLGFGAMPFSRRRPIRRIQSHRLPALGFCRGQWMAQGSLSAIISIP
jgi:hypothetical protein